MTSRRGTRDKDPVSPACVSLGPLPSANFGQLESFGHNNERVWGGNWGHPGTEGGGRAPLPANQEPPWPGKPEPQPCRERSGGLGCKGWVPAFPGQSQGLPRRWQSACSL